MNYLTNPFQELYVTDSPDPRTFVKLFSDFPVLTAPALFRPGNVVLKGTQGSGKSMLLNLLRPEIRLAYVKAEVAFPLHPPIDVFIGAGINLTLSGILDIGQRPLTNSPEDDIKVFPLYFADFLNYYVVRDLLSSLEVMRSQPSAYGSFLHTELYDAFAARLASQDCWFGSLGLAKDFTGLCRAIDHRITAYKAFHQYNGMLGKEITETKTGIGEPIARAADCLRAVGVIGEDVPVFIRIDQVERLLHSDELRTPLGRQYRRMVNKALGTRDSRVYYRIGTRKYGWDADLTIYGTLDKLEHIRDFRIIDLDDILQRKEDTKAWVFPDFAKDTFMKRLANASYDGVSPHDPLGQFFSQSDAPDTAARGYAGQSSPERILKLDSSWSPEWNQLLQDIYKQNPLEGVLAAAWGRQRSPIGNAENRSNPPPEDRATPWRRVYWRKERTRQALLQIAARAGQRLKWSGKEQVLALSGGNITVFLSICHEIWDVFLRAERRKIDRDRRNPEVHGIDPDVQASGIQTASEFWYDKITEQPHGDDRKRFIDLLGPMFRALLLNDDAMSYPGQNGFSMASIDIGRLPLLKRFLEEVVSYGDLVDAPHTTKNRDRKQRRKYYLNPILSDFFQIPESHPKEPLYASLHNVLKWLKEAEVILGGSEKEPLEELSGSAARDTASLFPESGEVES
jgi:hypothetical protein